MTYCIGIKCKTGVVALSDTRISSGLGVSTSKKIWTYQDQRNSIFVMSSGLRSIRDKVIHFFEDEFSEHHSEKLYKVVNLLGEMVKKVREEDLKSLEDSNFIFDAHFIVGGQCAKDDSASLFLVFPEGNWVEVSDESPYALIGNTGFGKPILRRLLHEGIDFDTAVKVAYLSFDATFKNASDVDFPIDFVLYKNESFNFQEIRKSEGDLRDIANEWNNRLVHAAETLPNFLEFSS